MRRRKCKPLPPRRKRMDRAARLQSAAGWLKRFEGFNVVRSYARWFGVDLACALKELRRLGVELDRIYVSRLETTLRNRPLPAAANPLNGQAADHANSWT